MTTGRELIAVPVMTVPSVRRVSRHGKLCCGRSDGIAPSRELDAAFAGLRAEPHGEAAAALSVPSQSVCAPAGATHTDGALERDMLAAFLAGGLAAIWLAVIVLLAVLIARSEVPLIFLGGVGFACLCWFTSSVIRGTGACRS